MGRLLHPDGVFIDNSVAVTYRRPDELGKVVENYGTAFSECTESSTTSTRAATTWSLSLSYMTGATLEIDGGYAS